MTELTWRTWQLSRYLWRGSGNFKIKKIIIFKSKMVISRLKILIHLLKRVLAGVFTYGPIFAVAVLYIMALVFTFQSSLLIYLLLRCIKFLCYTFLKLKTISVRLNQVIKYHMNYLFELYHTSYWNPLLQTLQSVAHSSQSRPKLRVKYFTYITPCG